MKSDLRCLITAAIAVWVCLIATGADAQQAPAGRKDATSEQHPCVVVTGAVAIATRVEMRRPLRLMEALFLAGGLTDGAGQVVRVVHSSSEIGCAEIPTAGWKPNEQQAQAAYKLVDLKRDEEKANPYLQPGDIVEVERLPSVGVVGCVAKGRWFHIRAPITLSRAVAMAGGPTKKAHRVAILRQNPASPEWPVIIQGDLDLISKGKARDPLLQSGDTVEVGRKGGDMCGVHIFW